MFLHRFQVKPEDGDGRLQFVGYGRHKILLLFAKPYLSAHREKYETGTDQYDQHERPSFSNVLQVMQLPGILDLLPFGKISVLCTLGAFSEFQVLQLKPGNLGVLFMQEYTPPYQNSDGIKQQEEVQEGDHLRIIGFGYDPVQHG